MLSMRRIFCSAGGRGWVDRGAGLLLGLVVGECLDGVVSVADCFFGTLDEVLDCFCITLSDIDCYCSGEVVHMPMNRAVRVKDCIVTDFLLRALGEIEFFLAVDGQQEH